MGSLQATIKPFIEKLERHSSLGTEERSALEKLPTHVIDLPAGEDFVEQGEIVEEACLLVSGLVGRFALGRNGGRQITGLHIPGDWADLFSVVVPRAGRALQTLAPSTILRIPNSDLRSAARQHPQIAEAFWRECILEAVILGEWVINIGRRQARARIANLLCELACRLTGGPLGNAVQFTLPATQQQLGEILGMSLVHVNRTLKALRDTGLADVRAQKVEVLDWDQLAQLGEFEGDYLAHALRRAA